MPKARITNRVGYPAGPRDENGSVEGVLTALGLFREKPAIPIAESKSKRHIWCRLNDRLREQFSDKAVFEDFWKNQRVIVRGKLRYAKAGELSYVVASDLHRLETRDVPASAIADRSLTGGLPIAEYLERFREGTLGE
jgi:hypothetical protein